MKIKEQSSIDEAQVQIIPLIDVIFCILTFFILAALQFTREQAIQAINVDLPKADSAKTTSVESQGKRQILPVTVDAVGQTYVEKKLVQREELGNILKNYLQQNPNGTLALYASRAAAYNDVIEVLDLLRQVGGERVALAILPNAAQTTSPNPQTVPNIPFNPGLLNPPGTPLVPINPQGIPNPNITPGDNLIPLPNLPTQPPSGENTAPAPDTSSPPSIPESGE